MKPSFQESKRMRKLNSPNGWLVWPRSPYYYNLSSSNLYKMQPDANHPVLYCSVFLSQPYKEGILQMSNLVFVFCFCFFSRSIRETSLVVPTEPLPQSVEYSVARL